MPVHDLDCLTKFERKFRTEGRPIYRMRWKRLQGELSQAFSRPVPLAAGRIRVIELDMLARFDYYPAFRSS